MKVKVLNNISYAGLLNHSINKGEIVPVIEATNLPLAQRVKGTG